MNKYEWNIACYMSKLQYKVLNRCLSTTDFRRIREARYRKYLKSEFITQEEANQLIRDKIISGQPLAVCRNGMGETVFATQLLEAEIVKTDKRIKHEMEIDFDKNPSLIERYKEIIKKSYQEADIVCAWYSIPMEEVLLREWTLNAKITDSKVVGVLNNEVWHSALADKNVLIISPFDTTIEEQYKKRTLLHKNPDYLPAFNLMTLQSIWWYSGGRDVRFQSWFEVYDYLYEESMKRDFDIALVSCSSFSTPLVSRFKRAGKQAIQIGGDLQVMFGIKGKRWDNRSDLDLYNEHWVRLEEKSAYGNVDVLDNTKGGAYW